MFTLRAIVTTGVLLSGGFATTQRLDTTRDRGFISALVADARHASIPAEMDFYELLLGSWDIRGTDYRVEGKPQTLVGRVEFARVLDGLAVQDIWMFQRDSARPFDALNRRVGTTVRIYDPVERAWNATWLDPVTRGRTPLTAHRVHDTIEHIGANTAGIPMRWTFTKVTSAGFAWKGEHSEDGGHTWKLNAEYIGQRPTAEQ